jgi:hypothetical protein
VRKPAQSKGRVDFALCGLPHFKVAFCKANFPAAENEFNAALIESNGESVEAQNNLQFCKLYKRNTNRHLLAELEFSRNKKRGE